MATNSVDEITVEMTSLAPNPTNPPSSPLSLRPRPAYLHPPPATSVHMGKRECILIAGSVLLGLVASCVAEVLRFLIAIITNVAFFGRISADFDTSPADNHLGGWVIPIPVIGGLIAGLMARFLAPEIRGHGIPEAMQSVLHNESRIKPKLVVLKPLSAAIVIGTGSPFGTEGPIIASGAALGSLAGQILPTTPDERKTLLAVGASAGMAGIFGTPLAAVMISVELLLCEYRPLSLVCVGLACFVSDYSQYIREIILNGQPFFIVPHVETVSVSSMLVYIVIGIIAGLAGALTSRGLFKLEDVFERSRIHWMWWPAIGAVFVGVIGYFVPRTLGVGYNNIQDIASDSLSVGFIALLVSTKFVSWIMALSSGTSGGTLAPMFTFGCGIGAIVAHAFNAMSSSANVSVTISALVGMASIFVAASRAILMSIVFTVEATRQINALPPLVGGCATALLTSWLVMPHSIMTEKIARRGRSVVEHYGADFKDVVMVSDVMSSVLAVVKETDTIQNLKALLSSNEELGALLVMDSANNLLSVLSRSSVMHAMVDGMSAFDLIGPYTMVSTGNTLRQAMDHMLSYDINLSAVVNPQEEVVGILSLEDCNTHQRDLIKQHAIVKRSIPIPKLKIPNLPKFM